MSKEPMRKPGFWQFFTSNEKDRKDPNNPSQTLNLRALKDVQGV
jgi:hypothetical protein